MSAAEARISHPGYDWFDIDVTIRREVDGLERVYRDTAIRDGWEWQWSEGNYGCDCNRHLFFERAGGSDPYADPAYEGECGESRYAVTKIVEAETGETLIEGDPAH